MGVDRKNFPHGWRTMRDGSRVPLTESEAAEMRAYVERIQAERIAAMPTTVTALDAISSAVQRLRDLGWTTMSPKEGETKACVQFTSTGMWEATRRGEYIHYSGCVTSRPKDMMFKPMDALTEDERSILRKCAKDLEEMHLVYAKDRPDDR